MNLNQKDKKVLGILFAGFFLSFVVVSLEGFTEMMAMLWLVSFILFMMFCFACEYGLGTNGFLMRFLAEHGAKNGLNEKQVYLRGQVVSAIALFVIPLLWEWAK